MSRAPGEIPSLDQGIFFVHLSRARKHLSEERYDLSRQELELAQLARPNDEDMLNLLSVIEFKRGYYHEAAQAARELLKNNPGSPVLHCNLGLILFKAGVLGEAEQELRRAVELKPDHARSHLYLGLLYRMRSKLGLALEHLRFAGAKKVVAEIEESLRRPMRETATSPVIAPEPSPGLLAAAHSAPAPAGLKLAQESELVSVERSSAPAPIAASAGSATAASSAPPTAPETPPAAPQPAADAAVESDPSGRSAPTRPTESGVRTSPIHAPPTSAPASVVPPSTALPSTALPAASPGPVTRPSVAAVRIPSPAAAETTGRIRITSVVPSGSPDLPRDTAPDPRSMSTGRETEGRPLFHVRPDGGLEIASRGVVFVRKGSVVWYSGKMRFASESSFRGTRLERILRADGRGYLFVNDPGRQAFRRDLAGQSLYLEGSRLLALDYGLSFRVEPIHDFRMNRRVDILKIQGRGSVILSVGGALLAHEVSGEYPLSVSSRDLVAWTGDLVPSVLEDRFLEEVMMPDVSAAPKIRFEGEGTVLTEPPRPRRRASDLARPSESDRRIG